MSENKVTLKSIRADIIALEELLLENEGEVNDTLETWLVINEKNLSVKTDAYHYMIDQLEQGVDFFKSKAEEANQARKQYESLIDRMKNNLKFTMQELNTDEIRGEEYRYKLSRSKPKVEITSEDKLPASYLKEKIVYSADKDLIKEDLDKGIEIDGARLIESYSLRSYLVKKGM
jgi:hypothetical protein